jgi:hypothetical protein
MSINEFLKGCIMSEQTTTFEIDDNQTTLFEVEVPTTEQTTTYSPYQCAKVINEELASKGIDKILPPQMFYTYTKKSYIKSFRNEANKVLVKHEDLVEWFVKYCKKNNIK